jgi:hypothetical protein
MTGELSGGSRVTATFARAQGRPFLHVNASSSILEVATFLRGIEMLRSVNVAGSRASKSPDIASRVIEILTAVIDSPAE